MKAVTTLLGTLLLTVTNLSIADDVISTSWQRQFQPLVLIKTRPAKITPPATVIVPAARLPSPVHINAEPAIKYLGQMQREGQTFIFAELDGQVYSAIKGEVIGKQYRLVDANDREAWVTRLSSNETVVLSLR